MARLLPLLSAATMGAMCSAYGISALDGIGAFVIVAFASIGAASFTRDILEAFA